MPLPLPLRVTLAVAVAAGVVQVESARAQQQSSAGSALDSLLSIPISAAAKYEQTAQEAAASISLITREDIQAYGFSTLGEALATVQGFYTTHDWTYTYLGVRGFGRPSDNNNRILLLVDGMRWNDIFNSEVAVDAAFSIPMEIVERIEVVRGPGSALYGSSAMLAVINVVTGSPNPEGDVYATMEGGSHDLIRGVGSYRGVLGGVSLTAFTEWWERGGPDLYFPEFDSGESDGWARGLTSASGSRSRISAEWRGLTLYLFTDRGETADPLAGFGSAFGVPGTFRSGGRKAVDLQYEAKLSARTAVLARSGFHRSTVDVGVAFDDPLPDRVVALLGNQWSTEVQLRHDLGPSNRFVIGAEHMRVDPLVRIGTSQWLPDGSGFATDMASVFGQNEWQIRSNLAVVLGARFDWYSTVGTALSPRGALVYHPRSGTTVKALAGSAYRAPTTLEQFIEEPPYLVDNPELGSERVETVELVFEQRLARGLQLTTSAYSYRMTDLIVLGAAPDERGLTYLNLDRARGRGLGADVTGRMGDGTSFFASAFVQSSSDGGEGDLANSPGYLVRGGAKLRLPGGLSLGTVVRHDAWRRTVLGSRTDAVTLVDATLRWPRWRSLDARLTVSNLLDVAYKHPAGSEHRQQGIPQAGRMIRLTLSAGF